MRHGLPLALFVVLMLTTWALTALVIFGAMRLVRTRRVAYGRVLLLVVAIQLATLTLVALGLRFGSLDAALLGGGVLSLLAYPIGIRWLGRASWKRTLLASLLTYVGANVVGWGLALLFTAHVLHGYRGASVAMIPTLQSEDRFVADLLDRKPRRWDVVVLKSPTVPEVQWVFRVVGLPGEKVELKDGQVLIDGTVVAPPAAVPGGRYGTEPARHTPQLNGGGGVPLQLGQDEYYVLGDNTDAANDSRYWETNPGWGRQAGAIPAAKIVGVVFWRYFPSERFGEVR
jgi:signal peptidase I